MARKKSKEIKKYILSLEKKMNFRKPFQLLLDTSFIQQMNKYKHTLKFLKTIYKSEPKLFMTKCTFRHLKKQTKEKFGFQRHIEIRNCTHELLDESDCIVSVIKDVNKYHFVLCTQNSLLIEKYYNKNVPLMKVFKSQIVFLDLMYKNKQQLKEALENTEIENAEIENAEIENTEIKENN